MGLTACNLFETKQNVPEYGYCERIETLSRYAMALRNERVLRHNAPNFFDDIRHPGRDGAIHPMFVLKIIEYAYSSPIEIGRSFNDLEKNKERFAANMNARCLNGQLGADRP